MKYIDLSHEIKDNSPAFPEDPEFSLAKISKKEDSYSLFKINGGLHVGTHIDAPYHYLEEGSKVNSLKLNNLIGNANIFKLRNDLKNDISNSINSSSSISNHEIKIKDIENFNIKENIKKNKFSKIAILNTSWYKNYGNEEYFIKNPYISKELAKLFIENNIKGIAIDSCSVDKYGENKIHKIFLKNDIWIVENLTNLDKLVENSYYSYFIPINIAAEASYIRAFVQL